MTTTANGLTARPAWQALDAHYQQVKDIHLRDLFADDGERRALSVALAVCDALHLPRPEAIHRPAEEGWQATRDEAPPNKYVFEVVKATRALVVGECVTRWGTAPRPGADGWKTLPRCWGRGW